MAQSATAETAEAVGVSTPAPPEHIVVVDDDPGVRTLLSRILRESGYEVSGVASGVELERLLADRGADLVLLDIMLADESGFDICREIRGHSRLPIIMVSARGQEADRVTGLDLGADDYIAKPFGRPELLARVRAVLRRARGVAEEGALPREWFVFLGWRYHMRRHELISPSGAEVDLTGAEHDLLLAFLRHPQRMIARERLLELSRSRIGHASDRSVDVLISRLRRKLRDSGAKPMIRTARGVGYMLAVDVELA